MVVNTVSFDDFHQTGQSQPSQRKWRPPAKQSEPLLSLVKPGQAVAIDCEGVSFPGKFGDESKGVARVAVVNEQGTLIYETYAYQPEGVAHFLPPKWLKMGVKYTDIKKENGAQSLEKVNGDVEKILNISGLAIGHAFHNDKAMLDLVPWSKYETRDTQQAREYQQYATGSDGPGLARLCQMVLGRSIQQNGHSPIEDARATMGLYLLHRDSIDNAQARPASLVLASTIPAAPVALNGLDSGNNSDVSKSTPRGSSSNATPTSTPSSSLSPVIVGISSEHQALMTAIKGLSEMPLERRVALPDLMGRATGRTFDKRISRYM